MGKKKGKHILMPPFSLDWPKVDKDTEDKIITALTQKLQEFPSLSNKKTKNGRGKSGQPAALPGPSPSQEEEDHQRKARLRRQLVIGHRQVSKRLDWNQLALVLVAGDAQPPILLRSLLPLAASRRCPALCLPSLHPRLTEALGLTSVLAIGVKKPQPGQPSDFEEFASMAAALAPPLSVPGMTQNTDSGSAALDGDSTAATGTAESSGVSGTSAATEKASSAGGAGQTVDGDRSAAERDSSADSMEHKEGGAAKSLPPAKDWQLMEPDQEKELMEKLLALVKPYESVLQTPRSKLTPDQLQSRKTINSCLMMDVGAVRTAALSGQLDLLLVHSDPSDPSDPHPHPHPALTPAIRTAVEKGCPVLHVASLGRQLGAVVRDTPVRAVGFKKSPVGLSRQPEEFRQFVTMAHQYAPTPHGTAASSAATESSSAKGQGPQSASREKRRKPACPVYDVSSLYVHKKDHDKNVPDSGAASQKEASETFISLSSGPSVQYLGVKSLGDRSAISDTAFVDSAGSGLSRKDLAAKKPAETGQAKESSGSGGFTGIMGVDSVDAPAVPPPSYHQPRERKAKGSRKRALDQSAERGEFVSFNVTPTAVQLSLPNPNKKKKHKKFKKK